MFNIKLLTDDYTYYCTPVSQSADVCICVCFQGIRGSPGLPGLIGREGPKVSQFVFSTSPVAAGVFPSQSAHKQTETQ